MALKITHREVKGVQVVQLDGRITIGEESSALREEIRELLGANKRKIVLNLENVTYIDSAGLGTLVTVYHAARTRGATLKLAGLGKKFHELLQVTKLFTVFEVHDDVAAAVQSAVEEEEKPDEGDWPGPRGR